MAEEKQDPLEMLVRWGEENPLVRAMVLTSSFAIPGENSYCDRYSDYDVILALSDVRPFHASRDWLAAFGTVLVLYRDPLEEEDGSLKSGNVVQFEEGLKIDFTLWAPEILRRVATAEKLDPEFDAGYKVLLDKDGLTEGIQPPSYRGYIPQPPSEQVYQEFIEQVFLEAIYAAKYLLRGDLMAAKFIMVTFMLDEHTRPMMEWLIELEHDWSVKPGPYGRRMKRWLRPDLWQDLEQVYVGSDEEENWQAIYRILALMRKVAEAVGARMGFAYPAEVEERVKRYLAKIRNSA